MSATTATSPLDAAREHLRQAAGRADNTEDWPRAALLSPLHDVADMVCRVGDHFDSSHYQADKAGTMVIAALRVRQAAFRRRDGFWAQPDEAPDPIGDLTAAVLDVERGIEACLWEITRGANDGHVGPREIGASIHRELLSKLGQLRQLVEALPTYDDRDDDQ